MSKTPECLVESSFCLCDGFERNQTAQYLIHITFTKLKCIFQIIWCKQFEQKRRRLPSNNVYPRALDASNF